jgi:hypothetical protein
VPEALRSPQIERTIEAGVAFLHSRGPAVADYPYTGRVSATWSKFGFPLTYWSDLLETAAVLVDAGYGAAPRLENVLALIQGKQDGEGRWKLENSLRGKMWIDVGDQGQPSKWITLRALRVPKRACWDQNWQSQERIVRMANTRSHHNHRLQPGEKKDRQSSRTTVRGSMRSEHPQMRAGRPAESRFAHHGSEHAFHSTSLTVPERRTPCQDPSATNASPPTKLAP